MTDQGGLPFSYKKKFNAPAGGHGFPKIWVIGTSSCTCEHDHCLQLAESSLLCSANAPGDFIFINSKQPNSSRHFSEEGLKGQIGASRNFSVGATTFLKPNVSLKSQTQ